MSFHPRWVLAGIAFVLIAGCAGSKSVTGSSEVKNIASADLLPLASLAPGVKQDMRYATPHNFMGKPIAGYEAGVCWLSRSAAQSLADVQKES